MYQLFFILIYFVSIVNVFWCLYYRLFMIAYYMLILLLVHAIKTSDYSQVIC